MPISDSTVIPSSHYSVPPTPLQPNHALIQVLQSAGITGNPFQSYLYFFPSKRKDKKKYKTKKPRKKPKKTNLPKKKTKEIRTVDLKAIFILIAGKHTSLDSDKLCNKTVFTLTLKPANSV